MTSTSTWVGDKTADASRPAAELVKNIKKTAENSTVNQAIDLLITEFMNGEMMLVGQNAGQFDHYIFDIFVRQLVWSITVYNIIAFRVVMRQDQKVAVIMEPIEATRIYRGYNEDKSRVVYNWVYDKGKDGKEITSENVPDNDRVHLLSMNPADINLSWFNSPVSDLVDVVNWMDETVENERDAHYASTHPLSYAVYRESNVKGSRPTDPLINDGLTGDTPRTMFEILRSRGRDLRTGEEPSVVADRVVLPTTFRNPKRMRAGELIAFTENGYELNMGPLPVANSHLIESNYFLRRIASRIGVPLSMLVSSIGGRHNIEDSRNEMAPLRASVARMRRHLDDTVIYLSRLLFEDAPNTIMIQWAKSVEITSIYTDPEKRDVALDMDASGSEEDSSDSDEPEHHSGSEHGPA